ncbi:conserved hypothetical protein [Desulforapulum autotrophicum HRM2]|uniref:DUF2062 domain-containing protein n=1 Tax=Desulforapulum autotrophicum (strain ATCC 43914 / DSM 3382 / VKM B-1955 / HRM2) TaxID=177437 RepID=C0QFJ1_DESAH|nr:DUF2062 domain-containing protein [Desulforapulum autotrophicum]ACN13387.1 conserved hypothetical protein [Desulforapulum autotrophicum HRM2]
MENEQKNKERGKLAQQVDQMLSRVRELQGNPHYVALGMAIGVFVSITPTIPFHTVIAVAMAYLLGASRPAAIIGVWVSNPFTVVFLYIACYKLGIVLFGNRLGDAETVKALVAAMESGIPLKEQIHVFVDFFHTRLKLFFAMIAGGVLLGIPCGIIAYFVTKDFVKKLHRQKKIKTQGTL